MKSRDVRRLSIALAGFGLVSAGSAQAQAWIGQIVGDMIAQQQAALQEQACMTGTAMPDKEVAEAQQPSAAAMAGYFEAVQSKANFAGFYHLDKRSGWSSGATSAGMAQIGTQADPFAGAGGSLATTPLGFVRAGDGSSAQGQWAVRDGSGALRGTYDAVFTRKTGIWRLSTLTLVPADSYVDPVVQYCHKPGDVLPYRLANTRMTREIMAKRVAKAEVKAQKASAALAAAQVRSGKGSAGATPAAQLAEAKAAQATEALTARRKELADAQAAEAQALADAKAADDAKAAAIAALGKAG